MNICIIGTGYVGLVTGACFAEFGVNVICVDKDRGKIKNLNKGTVPFYEPGLSDLVSKNMEKGRLSFTSDIDTAVLSSSVILLAVGTPPKHDGSADLRDLRDVSIQIARYINEYKLVVTKSTVPVGTSDKVRRWIRENLLKRKEFDVASNPEFLREGSAVNDFMHPDKVVIGANRKRAINILKELYRPLYKRKVPLVITNTRTAELIKYACNAFLATKISFINETANLCDQVGADVQVVADAMGLDGRISHKFLHPGPGFGGSCFPKDTRAFSKMAEMYGVTSHVVNAVTRVNNGQCAVMMKKIKDAMGVPLENMTIAVLGLSFKPDTDDVREAPSVDLIGSFVGEAVLLRVYDPEAMSNAKIYLSAPCSRFYYASDAYDAIDGADALVVVTDWNEFRNLDLSRVRDLLKQPYFFDLRNIYEPRQMKKFGFKYFCVGRR